MEYTQKSVKAGKASLVFLTFLGLYLISFVYSFPGWDDYFDLSLHQILFDILGTMLLAYCMIELSLYIDRKMNRYLPWSHHTIKRLLIQTGIQIFSLLVLLIFYAGLTFFLMDLIGIHYEAAGSEENTLAYFVLSFTFLMLIISMLNTVIFLSSNWKIEISKASKAELQLLRLQLDPHFVFNNLSVLSEIIRKDQRLGIAYTENFARVYRYLLSNASKQLISLSEEMKFLNAYLFLLKNRMGDGLSFEVSINPTQLTLQLPPVTLQLLVENAIKHNRVEKDEPLRITIHTTGSHELVVENNLLPLFKTTPSTGIGLENIVARYKALSNRTPQITKSEYAFAVMIPLIN